MEQLINLVTNLPKEEAKAFKKKIGSAADAAQIIAIVKELGLEISEKDADELFAKLNQITGAVPSDDQPISVDDMDSIAGGSLDDYGPDNAPWYVRMFCHYSICDHKWHLLA